MLFTLFKLLISSILIVAVSEIGKRSGKLGGLVLSLPISTLIAISWLWWETKDPQKIASLSLETSIFILPSLAFFIVLPVLLHRNVSFYWSMGVSIAVTLFAYAIFYKIRGISI